MKFRKLQRQLTFPLVALLAAFVLWEQRNPSFEWLSIASAVTAIFLLILVIGGKIEDRKNRS